MNSLRNNLLAQINTFMRAGGRIDFTLHSTLKDKNPIDLKEARGEARKEALSILAKNASSESQVMYMYEVFNYFLFGSLIKSHFELPKKKIEDGMNQHFVSDFIIQNFKINGKIDKYNLEDGTIKKGIDSNVEFAENYFYEENKAEPDFLIENFLGNFETEFGRFAKKWLFTPNTRLVNRAFDIDHQVLNLSVHEKVLIAMFVALQYLRVPNRDSNYRAIVRQKIKEGTRDKNHIDYSYGEMILSILPDIAKTILSSNWHWISYSNENFLFPDPVGVYEFPDKNEPDEVALYFSFARHATITFTPVSRNIGDIVGLGEVSSPLSVNNIDGTKVEVFNEDSKFDSDGDIINTNFSSILTSRLTGYQILKMAKASFKPVPAMYMNSDTGMLLSTPEGLIVPVYNDGDIGFKFSEE